MDGYELVRFPIPDWAKPTLLQGRIENQFLKEVHKALDRTIIDVLTQFLEREPTEEDFKKCTKGYKIGETDKFQFAYDDILLGTIFHGFVATEESGTEFKVTFTPAQKP